MDGWEIFKMYSLMQQHLVFIQQYGKIQNQLTHSNFFKHQQQTEKEVIDTLPLQ